jgi:putative ABC transport system substrate-binding protein
MLQGRRRVLGLLGGGIAAAAWPELRAQGAKGMSRLGVVMTGTPSSHGVYLEAFRAGLREAGLVEGRAVELEVRWMEGRQEHAPRLIGELLQRRIDVLVIQGISTAVQAKSLTRSVPIVVMVMANPVAAGVARSLARPGGNITGITNIPAEVIGKGVELLVALRPGVKRVAMLFDPTWPANAEYQEAFSAAASRFGLEPVRISAQDRAGVDALPRALVHEKPDGLLVTTNVVNNTFRQSILATVGAAKLPAVYPLREWALDGGLASYGSSNVENARRSASFVRRILNGEKPGDLPIEQSKLELVVNLKTAKALGIAIPHAVLVRADEVIQ